jgi:dTDP-4-amino-4,6-dideoxygalactose transaminase
MPDTSQPLPPIEFIDLGAQRRRIGARMEEAILRVVRHGKYIMGPEIAVLERQLSDFCGARHTISCSNGTDALALGLMARGVKPGEAVLCPSFTFAATAEVVAWLGATPVFVDVLEDTFNMDAASLEAGIASAKKLGLKPVAVIPVDLFGQPADYDRIAPIARAHGLWIMADAAQSFGAVYKGRKVGTIGDIVTTSFFPAKPLGCYGDGGAIFFADNALVEPMKSLRVHGQGVDKYDNVRIGMNGRLDTMQAAVLIEKLAVLAEEIDKRQTVARRYDAALGGIAITPTVMKDCLSVWAQYTLRFPGGKGAAAEAVASRRDAIAAKLKSAGVPTAIYYPKPLHRQVAYKNYPVAGNGLPVSDRIAAEVLSLPMHPYLDDATQGRIVEATRRAVA